MTVNTKQNQKRHPEFQKMLKLTSEFMVNEIYPLETKYNIHRMDAQLLGVIEAKRKKVKSLGLWAPQIPIDYGGMGLNLYKHGLMSEILAKSPFGHYVFNAQAPDAGNMEILIEYGNSEQKKKYLEPLVNGQMRSCFSMTEKDFAGSNPVLMGTVAKKEENEYVINGNKWFTSGADGASFIIAMCITSPKHENP